MISLYSTIKLLLRFIFSFNNKIIIKVKYNYTSELHYECTITLLYMALFNPAYVFHRDIIYQKDVFVFRESIDSCSYYEFKKELIKSLSPLNEMKIMILKTKLNITFA